MAASWLSEFGISLHREGEEKRGCWRVYYFLILFLKQHEKTLRLIFHRPTSGGIRWNDIEALFISLGAEITKAEGSRICVRLFGDRRIFHRPHPSPNTDKGAIASIRRWLEENEVMP